MPGFPLPPQPQINPVLPGASRALLSSEGRLSPRARLSPSVPNTEPTPRSGPRCELVKAQPLGTGKRHPAQGAAPSIYSQLLFLGTKVGVRGKDGFMGQKGVFSRGCWLGVTHPQQLSLLPGQAWHRLLVLTQLPGQSRAQLGPSHPARLAAGEGRRVKGGDAPAPPTPPLAGGGKSVREPREPAASPVGTLLRSGSRHGARHSSFWDRGN